MINIELTNDQIKKICNRNFIGCDQLIFIKKNEKIDADMKFYNSDGSEVRCLWKWNKMCCLFIIKRK